MVTLFDQWVQCMDVKGVDGVDYSTILEIENSKPVSAQRAVGLKTFKGLKAY